jgi:hypothetical protein
MHSAGRSPTIVCRLNILTRKGSEDHQVKRSQHAPKLGYGPSGTGTLEEAIATLPPRGYVYKYDICMTNHTPRKKRISPARGKVSTLSNFGSVYLSVFSAYFR